MLPLAIIHACVILSHLKHDIPEHCRNAQCLYIQWKRCTYVNDEFASCAE